MGGSTVSADFPGVTASQDFATTAGAFQSTFQGGSDGSFLRLDS